jgi:hypothetical protein
MALPDWLIFSPTAPRPNLEVYFGERIFEPHGFELNRSKDKFYCSVIRSESSKLSKFFTELILVSLIRG